MLLESILHFTLIIFFYLKEIKNFNTFFPTLIKSKDSSKLRDLSYTSSLTILMDIFFGCIILKSIQRTFFAIKSEVLLSSQNTKLKYTNHSQNIFFIFYYSLNDGRPILVEKKLLIAWSQYKIYREIKKITNLISFQIFPSIKTKVKSNLRFKKVVSASLFSINHLFIINHIWNWKNQCH